MVSGTQRRTTLGRPPAQVALVETCSGRAGRHARRQLYRRVERPRATGTRRLGSAVRRRRTPHRRPHAAGSSGNLHGRPDRFWSATGAPPWPCIRAIAMNCGSPTPSIMGRGRPSISQTHTETITPETFVNFISSCRTFLLESEAHELRRQGLGSQDLGCRSVDLRAPRRHRQSSSLCREPARHKILDLIGDLALFGHDLRGHVVAYRSGTSR